ncbi:MAG: hypothetical protein Q9162_007352 [Coniocarpon cinnabarinum]
MSQCEDILLLATNEGMCSNAEWRSVFEDILLRLNYNVFNVFTAPSRSQGLNAQGSSSDSTRASVPIPPAPNSPSQASPSNPVQAQQTFPASPISLANSAFPESLQSTYKFVVDSLRQNFSQKPPHTVQRLAELLLKPNEHHQVLFSYLNALDRVVSVSSPMDVLPLPSNDRPNGTIAANYWLNSARPENIEDTLGGDDALGGALLTPIPWLRSGDALAEEDNDHASPSPVMSPLSARSASSGGSEEAIALSTERTSLTRNNAAVTQAELLRAEQEGSDPPTLVAGSSTTAAIPAAAASDQSSGHTAIGEEDVPHARGPEEIGMEDTGQPTPSKDKALDFEAAIGRRPPARGHDDLDEAQGKEGEHSEVEERHVGVESGDAEEENDPRAVSKQELG